MKKIVASLKRINNTLIRKREFKICRLVESMPLGLTHFGTSAEGTPSDDFLLNLHIRFPSYAVKTRRNHKKPGAPQELSCN